MHAIIYEFTLHGAEVNLSFFSRDNQKLSLHVGHREVTQLEQDTYSKFVAEDSESSTGKRSYPQIQDEELKEQNVARLEESVVRVDLIFFI